MAGPIKMDGAVDFWANLKKQKEEEARQKELEAQQKELSYDESDWGMSGQVIEEPVEHSAQQSPVVEQVPVVDKMQSQELVNPAPIKTEEAISQSVHSAQDVQDEYDNLPEPEPEDDDRASFAETNVIDSTPHNKALDMANLHEEPVEKVPDAMSSTEMDKLADDALSMSKKRNSVKESIRSSYKAAQKSQSGTGKSNGKSKKKDNEPNPYCIVKKFPKAIMTRIQKEFPGATQLDALVAWIMTHCDETFGAACGGSLTEGQMAMVDSYEKDTIHSTYDLCAAILKAQQNIDYKLSTLQLESSYLLYDRLGFREGVPPTPEQVDLLENGVTDIALRAQDQTKAFRAEENYRNGRKKS